jgi:hypothetical protein
MLGRPCKIVDMSTSKTGKHGHAKVHLVAIDVSSLPVPKPIFFSQPGQIFTGKKLVSLGERTAFDYPFLPWCEDLL